MRKINYLKLGLDIVIALVFALLFNPRVMGGLTFHETAGIAIGAAILTHILLNFRWVKNVTAKLFDSKLSGKARFSYLLNIILLILMSITIVTGILISRVLFPNISVGNPFMIRHLHSMASNLALILVGVHLGIHWQWVMNVLKKMFIIKGKRPKVGGIAAAVLLVGLAIGGFEGRMGHVGGFRGHRDGSPLSVIMTYFGIMGIIMIPTYYVEKRIFQKKRKLKGNLA